MLECSDCMCFIVSARFTWREQEWACTIQMELQFLIEWPNDADDLVLSIT